MLVNPTESSSQKKDQHAKAQKPTTEQFAFFEKNVRPVLVEKCVDCHSGEEPESKLRLDSLEGLLTGGTRGPSIVPGSPRKSLLISAINHGELLQMPAKEKLSAKSIADITHWVKMGAPWPNAKIPVKKLSRKTKIHFTAKDRQFWAFQQPKQLSVPVVKNQEWVRNPIDAFILHELEKKHLSPAPSADLRTLIRRVTYDLTGLPPSPKEVQNFLNDKSPTAYEKLIDRLLASPRYGEKWGRHWLDVARYADSNGMDENLAFANAFRYRDYVIRAFNHDKPYDRFLQEQLAGDLLPSFKNETETARHDRLIATGFLAVGPKMLADDDPVKKQMDIIDEQINTTCRAFMGMTLGCARCHDHKFDPISTDDYYALAGIFKSTKTMENFKVVAEWYEYTLASAEIQKQIARIEKSLSHKDARIKKLKENAFAKLQSRQQKNTAAYLAIAAMTLNHPLALVDGKTAVGEWLGDNSIINHGKRWEAEAFQRGSLQIDRTNWGKNIGVLLQTGDAEYDVGLSEAGNYQLELRYAAQNSRPVVLSLNGQIVKKNAAAKTTGSWYPKSQQWCVEGVFPFRKGNNILRLARTHGPVPHIDKILIVKTDTSSQSSMSSQLREFKKRAELNSDLLKRWMKFLGDASNPQAVILREWLASRTEKADSARKTIDAIQSKIERLRQSQKNKKTSAIEKALQAALENQKKELQIGKKKETLLPKKIRTELKKLRDEKRQLIASKPKNPRAMGVREGKIQNVHVHIRGSHLTLGDEVPRRFLEIIPNSHEFPIGKNESGRLEFARWLTSPKHPLTSRVMVNRLWLWHFGTGLVRSPNNFGKLGERPTNQTLLDWLAVEFQNRHWSVKAMHKLILLSNTYRMSTKFDEHPAEVDPENRLHWRFHRRRQSAEEIRDSLLALGGVLDLTMGGQLMKSKNRAYVTGTGSKVSTYNFNRRSVYLPVLRSALYPVFQTFDFADPSVINGKRVNTTVAPQALFMMNSDLVSQNVQRIAKTLLRNRKLDNRGKIDRLYEMLYARKPADSETDRLLRFLRRIKNSPAQKNPSSKSNSLKAWKSLCHVLISSNEFIYVE